MTVPLNIAVDGIFHQARNFHPLDSDASKASSTKDERYFLGRSVPAGKERVNSNLYFGILLRVYIRNAV